MAGAAYRRGQSNGIYRTPDDFRQAVIWRFGVPHFDLACSPDNQFGVEGCYRDSLNPKFQWPLPPARCWLNPPYYEIGPWARKSAESGAAVLLLVPASVGSNWFRDYVFDRACVIFLNGRMSFDGKNPYPKDLILCDYGAAPGFEIWDWRKARPPADVEET